MPLKIKQKSKKGEKKMSQTVLMIDDCEILRNLAENIFKEHDYVVITSNSMECFEIFLEKHESIDLIIFDAGDLDISDEKVKIALEKFWEVKPGVKVIISGGCTVLLTWKF